MDTAKSLTTLNRIRTLSRLMDNAIRIPVLGYRIGLDPILGLVPGGGDLVSAAFSSYIIFLATRFGLPRQVLTRMIFNVGLEAVIGLVPVVGDLFDSAYKSNIRNLALLEQHLQAVDPELNYIASKVVVEEVGSAKKLGLFLGCLGFGSLGLLALVAAIFWFGLLHGGVKSPHQVAPNNAIISPVNRI